MCVLCRLKKNQTTPRPSEHPPVMGGKMSKRLGGIKRLQIQNLCVFCVVVVVVVSHIQRIGWCFVCFLPIHSGHHVRWTYQPGSHRISLIHLFSALRALIFLARKIQPFLSLVDREVEFCVLTI